MKHNVIVTSTVALVGLLGLHFLVNKLGFNQKLTKSDVADELEQSDEMITIKKCTYRDLTAAITPQTVVFPGDPTFKVKSVAKIDEQCSFNLCEMRMGNHMGTHIDFPAHVGV